MGFFDYFFAGKKQDDQPNVQLGRFSDAYKDEKKYDAWDESLSLFENEQYVACYKKFFDYLTDESADNFSYTEDNGTLDFVLYQGSKKLEGTASAQKVVAEVKIAKTDGLHIGFLRKLLEHNYQLKYCRYALDKELCITAVFSSSSINGSPYKLYYAFKELATHADKKDDIFISEFDMLMPINNGHIRYLPEEEVRLKYNYTITEIDKALDQLDNTKLNISHYPGAESYTYLDLIYRIDYLIKPEGVIMEIVDKIHNLYFHDKIKTPEQKNRIIRRELKKIREIQYEDFKKEIYEVKSTFGITQPSGQTRIQEFIESEIKNMDWYYQNKHDNFARAIPSYIIGYSLFNYSMPSPMRDFFNLYYQISQSEYFKNLGFTDNFIKGEKLNSSNIKKEIKAILNAHSDNYPELTANSKLLLFENECVFAKTYLIMIKRMNFQRKDHR